MKIIIIKYDRSSLKTGIFINYYQLIEVDIQVINICLLSASELKGFKVVLLDSIVIATVLPETWKGWHSYCTRFRRSYSGSFLSESQPNNLPQPSSAPALDRWPHVLTDTLISCYTHRKIEQWGAHKLLSWKIHYIIEIHTMQHSVWPATKMRD